MEKRGDITDQTPPEREQPSEQDPTQPRDKQAADRLEDHPSVRASEAAADQARRNKTP